MNGRWNAWMIAKINLKSFFLDTFAKYCPGVIHVASAVSQSPRSLKLRQKRQLQEF